MTLAQNPRKNPGNPASLYVLTTASRKVDATTSQLPFLGNDGSNNKIVDLNRSHFVSGKTGTGASSHNRERVNGHASWYSGATGDEKITENIQLRVPSFALRATHLRIATNDG
uniref:Uncharacterized protein n=1 Tax=Romanomermis culicivorax TaxID=13658 RepID=A0A915I163_ROMCU